jgi:hypothetical protein
MSCQQEDTTDLGTESTKAQEVLQLLNNLLDPALVSFLHSHYAYIFFNLFVVIFEVLYSRISLQHVVRKCILFFGQTQSMSAVISSIRFQCSLLFLQTSSYAAFQRDFALLKAALSSVDAWAFISDLFLVLKRCCTEKKFWASDELAFLVSHHCVTGRYTI